MVKADPVDAVVVGAGPAGLAAAEALASAGRGSSFTTPRPSPARKFLLAGRGGLNLTHSEPLATFLARYGPARSASGRRSRPFRRRRCAPGRISGRNLRRQLRPRVPEELQGDAAAARLAEAARWARRRAEARRRLVGLGAGGALRFAGPDGAEDVERPRRSCWRLAAPRGRGWGPTAAGSTRFAPAGVEVAPLKPANCGFLVGWSNAFSDRFAGAPLKAIALTPRRRAVRGEAMITATVSRAARSTLSPPLARRDRGRRRSDARHRPQARPGRAQRWRRGSAPRPGQSTSTLLRQRGLTPAPPR